MQSTPDDAEPGPESGPESADRVSGMRRAWAGLRGRVDAIGDDIALTMIGNHPAAYDRLAPDIIADIRRSTREHIRLGVAGQSGVPGASEEAVDLWRETGRRRARQGVPMEMVINAYTLGTRTLWQALMDSAPAGPGVDDRALIDAGQALWASLDPQTAIMVEAYRQESARIERQDLQRHQSVLDGLVAGRGADDDFAASARDDLGIVAEAAVACVVAPYDGDPNPPVTAEHRLAREGVVAHWHVRGELYFGLVAHRGTPADLAALLEPHATGRVGVAESVKGIRGFAVAFALAARTAQSLPRGQARVALATERLPELLLAASPEVTGLVVAESVGPLLAMPAPQSEVLLTTLGAVLGCDGSPTRAAAQLFCHRNTVIYRIKQIEELTGRSLTDPGDKLLLTLGLLAPR
ncbi:hypothetical protein GCM10011519_28560 [Marmoricola endophyticus]|uniref:PucR family transcriptional regulator n=1 Tax=Marmoricola endophyticus TaxID=2040280 RepID=A0A917F600_9ACTN|nr:PucR family transcriptional regulator [Marmoricola endophyticus]GGF52891.1 hypothetical protein GCM10011519_28560 [Marmoricola endophyticus]